MSVQVATSGKTVDREDKCPACGEPMLYRAPDGVPLEMFCERFECWAWLRPVAVPK